VIRSGKAVIPAVDFIESNAQDQYIQQRTGVFPVHDTRQVLSHLAMIALYTGKEGPRHPLMVAICQRVIELKIQDRLPDFHLTPDVEGGGLFHVCIYHDDDCGIWTEGMCTCEPSLEAKPKRGRERA
jgi:hypothetical protein